MASVRRLRRLRRLRRRKGVAGSLAALALAGLGALVPACADNESTIFVRNVLSAGSDCTVSPDPGGLSRPSGLLDVALRSEYVASLLVGNHLVARGDGNRLRTETSRVRLYATEVEVLDASGAVLGRSDGSVAAFSVPISGFAEPAAGATPGFGIAGTVLIDAATAASFRSSLGASGATANVIARVVVRGRTLGGTEVETPPFEYPITICSGCLVAFPAETDDPAKPGLDCDVAVQAADPICLPGQDEAVPCSLCRGNPVCTPPAL